MRYLVETPIDKRNEEIVAIGEAIIKSFPLFEPMSKLAREKILKVIKWNSYPQGTFLYKQTHHPEILYIILLGEVLLYSRLESGNTSVFIDSGIVLEDIEGPRSASAVCTMRTELLSIAIDDIIKITSASGAYLEENIKLLKSIKLFDELSNEYYHEIADNFEW